MSNTATATEAVLKTLKPETAQQAARLTQHIVVDATAIGKITPETYANELEQASIDLTQGIVHVAKEIKKFDTRFAAAGLEAFQGLALPIMGANKSVDFAHLVIPTIEKDAIDIKINRESEVGDGTKGEDGKPGRKIVYGQTRVKFDIYAAGDRGELAKVKENIKHGAAALFS